MAIKPDMSSNHSMSDAGGNHTMVGAPPTHFGGEHTGPGTTGGGGNGATTAPASVAVEPYWPNGDDGANAAIRQPFGQRAQPEGYTVTGPKGSENVSNPMAPSRTPVALPEADNMNEANPGGFNGGKPYEQAVEDEQVSTANQNMHEARARVSGLPVPSRLSPDAQRDFAAQAADEAVRSRGK